MIMTQRRNWSGIAVALAAGVVVALLGIDVAWAQKQMKIGVSTPPGYSYNQGLEEFKRLVEASTGGAVTVTIFPSAQLGGEVEMGKNVQLGTLEATVISTSNASPFHEPYQVLSVPYLLKSVACGLDVVHGPIGQELADALLGKAGIRTLGWYTFGLRQLFNTKRDVVSVADLSGLKIRVPPDKYLEATWRTLGASPVPMPFPELFSALQQGVVDGDANPILSIQQFKWYEVVKHVSLANVAVGISPFLVSERFFQSLPEDQQKSLLEAASASEKVNLEVHERDTEKAVGFLKEQGVKFVDVDLDEFRAAIQPVWDMAREQFGADLVERILAAQKDC